MRVVIVTESFPPDVNGVAHCTLQTARHLVARGHEPLVIAPAPAGTTTASRRGSSDAPETGAPCPVVRVPSLPLPGYPQVRVALPGRRLTAALAAHRAELVHLAGPFVLGARGMAAAARLGLPAVAVYQTDLAGYARTYLGTGENTAWRRMRAVHSAADRTLAPSTAALRDLTGHGVPRVRLWPRGVDTARFRPALRDEPLRRRLAPGGETIVGYVGRLAPEKHVELLAGACALPGVRVVVVGDGPSEASLRTGLPGAVFLGRRTGDDLARVFASLDVFVHTGPYETFCQTVQEAMACALPVIAPAAGGPLDLVDHGRTGLLVPPLDARAVADAVGALAADPARAAAYGATGRAAVEGRTWQAVGDQLLDHYDEVLRDRTAVAA
ncbi:glycosyltransferase family 1 protein [Streptomyces sp. NBC_00264]|uniref:glycosyltransferase family 4 protein n=1 Tax=unclassified Streptomyces TaxID=2593676 RepID=UPI000F5BBF84|nr:MULTISPECIES: glycosyltransferase family 1 protein [unclassified Streptomyces]WSG49533.1 glycosyltransferase family 1 protein [Streptomyces sp. NBC_01732]MCX5099278.1 glycosyltransferase family 1 protein [Streptomyces sp. NBC_00439]MCX5158823.1 glycosyltransferase family 1 protein [Streptomyces sp. NBC_00305]MCX5217346.1 glycosyltransferase family 1 protein [Streptomyces sp. NBC_00264]RPK70560.1 GDP-mannose-dependent alpha-mannosyltransferase [Streptomyces sp. ADI95-17]